MTDTETARVKQQAMRDLDEEHFITWLSQMDALNAEQLDDHTFTSRRQQLLTEWTRARKLAQARLNRRYSRTRRNPALVARDTTANQTAARQALTDYLERRNATTDAEERNHLRQQLARKLSTLGHDARS